MLVLMPLIGYSKCMKVYFGHEHFGSANGMFLHLARLG